jgi:hypothetical protein
MHQLANFNQSRFLLNMYTWQMLYNGLPVQILTKDYQSTQNEHELFQSASFHQAQWLGRVPRRLKSGNIEHDVDTQWRQLLCLL